MYLWINRLVITSLIALSFGLPFVRSAAARPGPGGLTCRACIIVDDTGAILWARRARAPLANASTTKMLTALTALELGAKAESEVVVSARAAATGGGGLDLETGDVIAVEELLYALLLSSSNDASMALAEHAGGSESAFVAAMNSLALHIGARDSHFATPHGLDTPGHLATAADLAAIGAELMARPRLARIVGTEHYEVGGTDNPEKLKNSNPLLGTYRGTVGIKTGFTDNAGEVLVAAARRHRRSLIVVAMGSRNAASDVRSLLDRGWAKLARSLLLRAREPVGEVTLGGGGSVVAVASDSVRGWARPGEVSSRFVAYHDIPAATTAGEPIGRVDVYWANRRVASAPALSATSLQASAAEPTPLGEVLGNLLQNGFRIASLLGASRP
ncbi:MAG: serine hydrolase [Actinomycetota bacterium]|nr:serine hydrolase [Actinomycetota bacterium]